MMAASGSGLLSRIVAEHRRPLIAIALSGAAAVLTYALWVYPLGQRVANIAIRERTAEQELAAAQAELGQVSGTLTGKAKAATELTTFYREVLPQDLAGARRLTSLRLAQLAREANLDLTRATYTPSSEAESTLVRLQTQMVLSGDYADIRTFIYRLETASEFVVIDNVSLGTGSRESGALSVTLHLSTYYQGSPPL